MSEYGLLIVFEGIDGSGKSSLAALFKDHLLGLGLPVTARSEPSDSRWGKEIRRLARENETIPIAEELRLFTADRRWHVKQVIKPALRQGRLVIMDRYYYSTACYQGARGLDMFAILKQHSLFAPLPDLVFIVDTPVEKALERISTNRIGLDKLFENASFLEAVRANYLNLSAENIAHVNGDFPLADVFSEILKVFGDRFPALKSVHP